MAGNIFSQIVPLTVAMVLPMTMIKSIRYLLGGRPVVHSLLMIVTWGITFFLVLGIAAILHYYLMNFFEIKFSYAPSGDFSGWEHIIMGVLLLVVGIKRFKTSLENQNVVKQYVPTELVASSIVVSTIKTELIGWKNTSMMIMVIYIFLERKFNMEQSFIAAGLIAFTSMIWVSMPLFVYFLAGHDKDNMLESLNAWLMQNKDTLIILIYLFIGISVLSSGIGELMPKFLETVFEDIA